MSTIITFDDSLWPLLIIRISGTMTEAHSEEFFTRSRSFLERGERHVTITDLSKAGLPTSAQRRRQAEWLRTHDTALRACVLGNATIITSASIRLAVSLILHLKFPPMPHAVVSDLNAALSFVLGKLEAAGLVAEAERIRHHYGPPAPAR